MQTQQRTDDRTQLDQSNAHRSPEPPNSPRPNRRWLKLAIAVAVVSGSFGAWLVTSRHGENPPPALAGQPPRPVEVTTLAAGDGVQTLDLIGEVEATDSATVRAQTMGTVMQVLVDVGDRIEAGQPIVILDTADQQLALAEARAALASARSDLAELEAGTRSEIIAQRQAELEMAKAREREARQNLGNVEAMLPSLIAQREAELEMATAREREALDNLERTRSLTTTGALSNRSQVEAETRASAATSDRLRAASALAQQITENQQSLSQARASLDAATSEQMRAMSQLAEATAGPRQEEIEAQRGLVQAAQAAVSQAELARDRATIVSNAAGYVRERPVNVGDYVEANDPAATVVSRDRLDVFLEIPEDYSGQVDTGTRVSLSASALPDWRATATIAGVVPTANEASRRQRVRVRLDNSPENLVPGMAIAAQVELPLEGAQFVLERDVLTRRRFGWVVYVVHGDTVKEVPVDVVADLGDRMAIASPDLSPGQTLVSKGGDGLRDGAEIQIVE